MSDKPRSWVDGVEGSTVPVDDRGLQYGDGLFETMLVRAGRVRFLEAHLARLALGCARLAIPAPGDAVLRAEIAAAAAGADQNAILKLILSRGSGPRGYSARGAFAARRVMSLFPPATLAFGAAGAALRFARHTISENPMLAGLKHLNRLDNVLAASEPQHEHSFDALLLDPAGLVVGGTFCNVFLVREGVLVTPSVERAGVAGVMRGIVLRECAALGLDCAVRAVPASELHAADEVFVTNARIGVVPVSNVGEHAYVMNGIATRISSHVEALDA